MNRLASLCCVLALLPGAEKGQSNAPTRSASGPEIERLAKALAGDWDTAETMERSEFFPNGGSRQGIAHVRLVAGGTTLLDEVRSNGSAGELDGMVAIWWDQGASAYRFFVCFNDPRHPCKVRGTARWEGDRFINDYEETVNGRKSLWRDTFLDITSTSHTLVAAVDSGDGNMKTLITTRSTRRQK